MSAIRSTAFRTQFEQWLSTRIGELPAPSTRSSSTSQQGDRVPTVRGNPNDKPLFASSLSVSQLSPASRGEDSALAVTSGGSNETPPPPPPSSQSSSVSQEGDVTPAEAGSSSNDAPLISLPPPENPCTDQISQGRSPREHPPIRYLLWCVNLGRSHTVVESIHVTMGDTDQDIFGKLRRVYNETRSWRRAILIFHTLREIRYVKVSDSAPHASPIQHDSCPG